MRDLFYRIRTLLAAFIMPPDLSERFTNHLQDSLVDMHVDDLAEAIMSDDIAAEDQARKALSDLGIDDVEIRFVQIDDEPI